MIKKLLFEPVSTLKKFICVVLSLLMVQCQIGFGYSPQDPNGILPESVSGTAQNQDVAGLLSMYFSNGGFQELGIDPTKGGVQTAFCFVNGQKVVSFTCEVIDGKMIILTKYNYNDKGRLDSIVDSTTGSTIKYGWVNGVEGGDWRAINETDSNGKLIGEYIYSYESGKCKLIQKNCYADPGVDDKGNPVDTSHVKGADFNGDGVDDVQGINADGCVLTEIIFYDENEKPQDKVTYNVLTADSTIDGDPNSSTQRWYSAAEISAAINNTTNQTRVNGANIQPPPVTPPTLKGGLLTEHYEYQWDPSANSNSGDYVLKNSTNYSLASVETTEFRQQSHKNWYGKTYHTTVSVKVQANYVKAETTTYDSHGQPQAVWDTSGKQIGTYTYRGDGTLASMTKIDNTSWQIDVITHCGRKDISFSTAEDEAFPPQTEKRQCSKSLTTTTTFDSRGRTSLVEVKGTMDIVFSLSKDDDELGVRPEDCVQVARVSIDESFGYNYNDTGKTIDVPQVLYDDAGNPTGRTAGTGTVLSGGLATVAHESHTYGSVTFDISMRSNGPIQLNTKTVTVVIDKKSIGIDYYNKGKCAYSETIKDVDKGYTTISDPNADSMTQMGEIMQISGAVLSTVGSVMIFVPPVGSAVGVALLIIGTIMSIVGAIMVGKAAGTGTYDNPATAKQTINPSNPGYRDVSTVPPVELPTEAPVMARF